MRAIPVIDLSNADAMEREPLSRRFWYLIFLLALKDRALEIRFEPGAGLPRLAYLVDGVVHNLVPPPAEMAPRLVRDLKKMVAPRWAWSLRDFLVNRDGWPADPRMCWKVGGYAAEARVWTRTTAFGESLLLEVVSSDVPWDAAQAVLKLLFSAQRDFMDEADLAVFFKEK